jgi:hypothetical protein
VNDRWQQSPGRRTAGTGAPDAPAVSGVFETIAAGFSLALWRPRLLLIPVIIDLLLWLGLQVSAQPLTTPLGRLMAREGGENGELAADQLARVGAQAHVNDLVAWLIPSLFAGVPSDTVLSALLSFVAPPLMDGIDREEMYARWGDGLVSLWQPGHWFLVVSVALVCMVVGSVLLVLFRVPLAQAVRGRRAGAHRLVGDLALAWLRVVGLISLVGLVAVLALGPLLLLTALLLLFGLDVSSLLALVLIFGGGLVAIYTVFTVDAIVLSQVGPLRGLRQSFEVVRANFGPTVRFALSSLLIATGSFQLWQALVGNPPGIVLSLFGNAFIGTGLILASMMFFHDRFRLLQRTPPPTGRGRA